MLVIMKETIDSLGKMGAEVNVADGYARNYLIPNKMVLKATPGNRKSFDNEMKQRKNKLAKLHTEASDLANKIETLKLSFTKKAGQEGKLFGSLSTQEVAEKLSENGIEIDKKKISIAVPAKTVGIHTFTVRLHSEVKANINVEILPEEDVEEVKPEEQEA